jgi:hypothetical protein
MKRKRLQLLEPILEPMLELTNVQIISVSGGKGGATVTEHHSHAMSNVFLKIKLTETG